MDDVAPAARAPSRAYSNYVLGVLVLVYVMNYVDRQLISILIEPIKAEFGASDKQMGLLTGFAFAIFYTVAGIPVARLADVWVRRSVIAIGLSLWSGMTALTGFSRSFLRAGAGAHRRRHRRGGRHAAEPRADLRLLPAEAARHRARRLLAGRADRHDGRLLARRLARRPVRLARRLPLDGPARPRARAAGAPHRARAAPRRSSIRRGPRAAQRASTREVLRHMFGLSSFRWIVPGVCLASFSGYGFAIWKPVFLMRVHDFSMAEAGLWIGLLSGATGFVSTLAGGFIADWLARRDPAWALRLCAFSILGALPFQLAFLLYPDPMIALALFIPGGLVGGMWPPPSYAATQNLVPPHMRALASAILLFFLNLVGLGAGPFAVGWISDALAPSFGAESVRWALVIPLALNVFGAFAYWRASKSYAAELAAAG